MDINKLIDALSEDEKDELRTALTVPPVDPPPPPPGEDDEEAG